MLVFLHTMFSLSMRFFVQKVAELPESRKAYVCITLLPLECFTFTGTMESMQSLLLCSLPAPECSSPPSDTCALLIGALTDDCSDLMCSDGMCNEDDETGYSFLLMSGFIYQMIKNKTNVKLPLCLGVARPVRSLVR